MSGQHTVSVPTVPVELAGSSVEQLHTRLCSAVATHAVANSVWAAYAAVFLSPAIQAAMSEALSEQMRKQVQAPLTSAKDLVPVVTPSPTVSGRVDPDRFS
jgi:hypothetical protein